VALQELSVGNFEWVELSMIWVFGPKNKTFRCSWMKRPKPSIVLARLSSPVAGQLGSVALAFRHRQHSTYLNEWMNECVWISLTANTVDRIAIFQSWNYYNIILIMICWPLWLDWFVIGILHQIRWAPPKPTLFATVPSYYYYTIITQINFSYSFGNKWTEVPMHQRMWHLDTICKSYEGSNVFVY